MNHLCRKSIDIFIEYIILIILLMTELHLRINYKSNNKHEKIAFLKIGKKRRISYVLHDAIKAK